MRSGGGKLVAGKVAKEFCMGGSGVLKRKNDASKRHLVPE